MKVAFEGTNQVNRVEATGNVRIKNGPTTGKCRRALYRAKSGRIDLLGDAQLQRDASVITADLITFYIRNDEVHSVNAKGNVRMRHVGAGDSRPLFPAPGPRSPSKP
jgi:lipopolysaccharide transport protein LptA